MDGCWTLGRTCDEFLNQHFRRQIANPHIKPKMPKVVPKIIPKVLLLELGLEGLGGLGGLEGLVSVVVAIVTYVVALDERQG